MASEVEVIEPQEIETMRADGSTMIERAKQIARDIKDAATLNFAAEVMLEAKRRAKAIQERFKKPKQKAMEALQEIRAMEAEAVEPYTRIEQMIIKPAMAQFQAEQDRLRREEEDRQRAEAKRREEDARLREAAELEKDGQKELADAIMDAPVVVPPVVLPKMETPTGISYRDVWKFEVVNPDLVPREYLTLDEKKIGGVVRALKGETRIAGVRVYSEKTVAGRV